MSTEELSTQENTELNNRTIETVTGEICLLRNQSQRMAVSYAIEIGRRLVEAKKLVPYGTWGDYLHDELGYAQSTANNLMKIFTDYGASQQSLFGASAESQTIGNLTYTKALALLALPAEEREEFAAENNVEDMSSRELVAAIKEREEALAEAKAAEDARSKMAQDMKMANDRLDAVAAEKDAAAEKLREALAELEKAKRDVNELKERPIEIVGASVPDEAALEKARNDGRDHAMEEAKAEKEKAAKKLKIMEDAKKAAEEKYEAEKAKWAGAEKDIQAAKNERDALKKQLSVAGNENVTAFKFHFNAAQSSLNSMMAYLEKMLVGGDLEHYKKLLGAVVALGQKMVSDAENLKKTEDAADERAEDPAEPDEPEDEPEDEEEPEDE